MASIGIAIITHTAKRHLPHCLPPLLASPLHPRLLVVNSSSSDGTVELAKKFGAETLTIPRQTFNHGATRELARHHLGTDIVVMMTPDAYAVNASLIATLTQPLRSGQASLAYARQIPHGGADIFEAFPREFSYPEKSHIRSIADLPYFGAYTFFCSNACAAYNNTALDEIGGFPNVLIGEDSVVAAKLLRKSHHIAYVAEAIVCHSHRYTWRQEFKRYFDTGLARHSYRDLLAIGGKDEKEGWRYFTALMKKLAKEDPLRLPAGFIQTAVKWLGYQIGKKSLHAPLWIKKRLSSQDFYW